MVLHIQVFLGSTALLMLWLPIRIVKLLFPAILPYNFMLPWYTPISHDIFLHLTVKNDFYLSIWPVSVYMNSIWVMSCVSAALPLSVSCCWSCCCCMFFCPRFSSMVSTASVLDGLSMPGPSRPHTCCMLVTHTRGGGKNQYSYYYCFILTDRPTTRC